VLFTIFADYFIVAETVLLLFVASVGPMVIQLAKLSRLTVITTTSPKNVEYLKSLGADYVFPYNDPKTPEGVRGVTNGKLYLAYDAISEKGTTQLVINIFGSDSDIPEGKKVLINLLYVTPDALDAKADTVKENKIQHQRVKVLGGLEKVPEGFAYMREGR